MAPDHQTQEHRPRRTGQISRKKNRALVARLGFMVQVGIDRLVAFDLHQCDRAQFVLSSRGVGGGRCMPKDKTATAIQQRARKMWRQDGSPTGRLDDYIERARELQAIINNPMSGLLPNPIATYGPNTPPLLPVEEAELMENLGEFPTRFTDQGDHMQTPMTKQRARQMRQQG